MGKTSTSHRSILDAKGGGLCVVASLGRGLYSAVETQADDDDVKLLQHGMKPSSDTSIRANQASRTSLNSCIKSHKTMMAAKKMHRKKRKSIQNMFDKLLDQSISNTQTNDDSVIILHSNIDNSSPSGKRHKKQKPGNSSTIVIDDDDESHTSIRTPSKMNTSPLGSSTPLTVMKRRSISSPNSNNNTILKNPNNSTRRINSASYLTIDLTREDSRTTTVVNLIQQDTSDCTFVSAHSSNSSMSGDSDVTVISAARNKESRVCSNKYEALVAKMTARDKCRLFELITKNVFNGCKTPVLNATGIKGAANRTQATAEDTYIKEVILASSNSRNSIGSNIYNPTKDEKNKTGLRMIVIDGSNVAMEHGRGKVFSVRGLQICIDYFVRRGHVVKAFVPRFRCKYGKSSEPRLLDNLEKRGLVVYTPSREIQGRLINSYDDRYIVQCAAEFDGVIVSGDNYRDLLQENPRWRFVIENRLLPFTWVNDMLMFPKDPLGRNGPTLERFLKHLS